VDVTVRPLILGDAEACDAIVRSLPYHFGDEDGLEQCRVAVRSQDGLVALEDGVVIGFLTYEPRFAMVAEITWMAVRADRRRRGVGHRLMERFADEMRAAGRRLLLVLTVSPSDGPDDVPDGYQATRAFYARNGFVLARDIPGLWTSDTPVLMIRTLDRDD
jgi:GNAT superfamily N-acetyltransferase